MENNKGTASVLYVTYIDFDKALSGSSVRPQNMYRAFVQCGYDVKLLKGQQNKRKQRRANVREVLEWLDANRPDICYVEPPTGPFFNSIDHRLLKKVHKMGIPIGLFYRDAYWKYNLIDFGKGLLPALKAWMIRNMQKRDLARFNSYCDIIYLPSALAVQEWGFSSPKILPPGSSQVEMLPKTTEGLCGIYVGGVSSRYGIYKLLDAFRIVNQDELRVTLRLVCRENEWASVSKDYRSLTDSGWLQVKHADGDALAKEYSDADFALCTLEKDYYNDLAIPIKLLEYISYGKPVIGTNCVEIQRFIEENQVGIVADFDAAAIAQAILRLAEDVEYRQAMALNCLAVREKNTWTARVEQVVRELSELRER